MTTVTAPTRTCHIASCQRPRYQKRRYCVTHAMRASRYGDPHHEYTPTRNISPGQRFGHLTVIAPDGYRWQCACECGAVKTIATGNLNRGQTTCGDRTAHRRAATVGYFQAHRRLSVDRGPASDYPCTDCGNSALHWSYNNASEHELTDPATGLRYSLDQDDYTPRCAPCHAIHDGQTTRAA